MKKSAVLLATILIALPLFARPSLSARMKSLTIRNPETQSVPASVAASVYAQWRASVAAKHNATATGTVHTSAITDSRSSRVIVIPAAGSVAGGGGALFFRSDVTLVNYEATAHDVIVMWWPAGTSNTLNTTGSNVTTLTLQPSTFNTYPDFVANTLHQSGLGSILIIPVVSGQLSFDAGIDGFSRIYTKQPGSNGTVSQEFPGVDPDNATMFNEGVSLGLRQDADYRTNWGIVNTDSVSHSFHLTFMGENNQTATMDVTVPAFGMIQQAAPAGAFGALTIIFSSPDITDFAAFIAYASSTDNTTGDGWVSLASGDYASSDLDFFGV
ncbi:MAG TPA: hypothetical protein VGJ82_02640 [Thermoanaerobaculia bacterium]|jgi:hypothetical protein